MSRQAHIIVVIVLFSGAAQSLRAGQINPTIPPPPPAASEPSTTNSRRTPPAQPIDPTVPPPPPSAEESADSSTPSGPAFDPLHAERSMEVGTFYLKKGIYDAAIDRFAEAANYQPNLAMPWKLMGEAYEKKHEYAKAVESYKKYLKLFPHAEDAAKVKKRISELEDKTGQPAPKSAEH